MHLLDIKQYDKVKHLFEFFYNFAWLIDIMETKGVGKIYTHDASDYKAAYIETPFSDFYMAGTFNQDFFDDIIHHIIHDIMPKDEDKLGFFYTSDHVWRKHLDEVLLPFEDLEYGSHLIRKYHQIDLTKYQAFKKHIPLLPAKYHMVFDKADVSFRIYDGDKEICHCQDFGQGAGIMDLDVFTDEAYRHQGLAQISCVALIDYCLSNDIVPLWGCWDKNIKSCRLANKIGFECIAEEQVNFANFINN